MKVKNIFKKNQIIIFALAIMIAIAGYLNFSKDKTKESEIEEAASSAVDDNLFAEIDGEHYSDYGDISDEDELLSKDSSQDEILVVKDTVSTEDNIVEKQDDSKEVASDKSDAEAANVDENASDLETTSPGEAILASTTISPSYFSTARLTREQNRARNRASLMEIISDPNTSQELRDEASDAVMELTTISEKENSTEILLEAKGYQDAVVSIVEDSVDVIVNNPSLTDQDMAIIEDVVMRKTGAKANNIAITCVVTEE